MYLRDVRRMRRALCTRHVRTLLKQGEREREGGKEGWREGGRKGGFRSEVRMEGRRGREGGREGKVGVILVPQPVTF